MAQRLEGGFDTAGVHRHLMDSKGSRLLKSPVSFEESSHCGGQGAERLSPGSSLFCSPGPISSLHSLLRKFVSRNHCVDFNFLNYATLSILDNACFLTVFSACDQKQMMIC